MNVIVTGGTRGIGYACVRRFAKEGHRVAFVYRKNEALSKEIEKEFPSVHGICADISNPGDVKRVFAEATGFFGPLDVLVNNAGICLSKLVNETGDEEFKNLMDTNFSSAFYACRESVSLFLEKHKGSIINISSVWGQYGASCESVYSASKAALIGFTKALSKELSPSGIRVNCVCPGVIDTDMNACYDSEAIKELCEETPMGRLGTADEVANCVYFLSGEEASFITGQIIGVNGGFGE